MEGKAADDNIKRVVLEGEVLGVTHDKVEVGKWTCSNIQHTGRRGRIHRLI